MNGDFRKGRGYKNEKEKEEERGRLVCVRIYNSSFFLPLSNWYPGKMFE